jgi:C-terminal processing protease CtpA/Prc
VLVFLSSCAATKNQEKEGTNVAVRTLPNYSENELLQDFDLLIRSLKEAHTGLYWYSSEKQFDSIAAIQRNKINDSLNGLQFYNILAPVVAFTKEDHCDISISDETKLYLNENRFFLPLYVKNIGKDIFIVNDLTIDGINLKGLEIIAINGEKMEQITSEIHHTFAADGYIESSKEVFLDGSNFSVQYAKVITQRNVNQLKVRDAENNEHTIDIRSINKIELTQIAQNTIQANAFHTSELPAEFKIIDAKTSLLTFNTFSNRDYKNAGMNFKIFVDSVFTEINQGDIQHLIIDVRENGGGTEGNEDYLFSYLTNKPYNKYKEVELSNFEFSFIQYTDYSSKTDTKELYNELRKENRQLENGKIIRKPNLYIPEPPKENPFSGKVYILTSGWTYSGGAEFCSLMKEHTNALFIGQEVGGGFYGNTSGTVLELTLPVTKIKIDIPILKFNLDVSKGIFGRGVIPDYTTVTTFEEYINGTDKEIEKALELIRE